MPTYKYNGTQEVSPFGVTFNAGETHEVPQPINHPSFELVNKKEEKKEEKEPLKKKVEDKE